jgi:hypothetical protein
VTHEEHCEPSFFKKEGGTIVSAFSVKQCPANGEKRTPKNKKLSEVKVNSLPFALSSVETIKLMPYGLVFFSNQALFGIVVAFQK